MTLHRVGIEADPVPGSRSRLKRAASTQGTRSVARYRAGHTRTACEGGRRRTAPVRASDSDARQRDGPRTAWESTPTLRRGYNLLFRAGLTCASARQRPGHAAEGTGPKAVRRRLNTQRSHVEPCTRVGSRGTQAPTETVRVRKFFGTLPLLKAIFKISRHQICRVLSSTISYK